ncbi:MAG TPA: Bpu10I family restriction endonuclease [Terriglobia bacterium]|nr:Bpu10I family restriction endonuclease [Terriglobia bacterium]
MPPHLDKLNAVLENAKLPVSDRPAIEAAKKRYREWAAQMDQVKETQDKRIDQLVRLLNDYRLYLDVDVIFDSEADFLYRQKGQLKLDNSVIEEFLPWLICPAVIPELKGLDIAVGPVSSYSSLFFKSSLENPLHGGGLSIRSKDQDFAISRPLYIKASHSKAFDEGRCQTETTSITYVAAECKTNLDKTMFQEACATARDTKFAVAGAKYYLLVEWLDMTPLSTAATDIDEVLILRKAKRVNSNVRSEYAVREKRRAHRQAYIDNLKANPFSPDVFRRFVQHVAKLLRNEAPEERNVLRQGYF